VRNLTDTTLTSVVTKNSSGTTTESIGYTYDTENRRISQTATGTTNVSEQYVYDGTNLLAVLNPSTGQMVQDYFNGLNADGQTQAFAEETLSSNASTGVNWMLTDNVGSVKDVVTNASGHAVLDHIVYDSYGDILSQTNSANDTRIGYAGYVQDKATTRDYANARYYQPYTGRFISQDPSGFAAGDTNLYRYVGNAPTTATDPTGLYAVLGSGSLGQFNSSYGWEPSSSIADSNYYSTTKSILDVNSGSITGATASPSDWNIASSGSSGIDTTGFTSLSSSTFTNVPTITAMDFSSASQLGSNDSVGNDPFSYLSPFALPSSTTFHDTAIPHALLGTNGEYTVAKTTSSDYQGTVYNYKTSLNHPLVDSPLNYLFHFSPEDSFEEMVSSQTFHNLTPEEEQQLDTQIYGSVDKLNSRLVDKEMEAKVLGVIGGPEAGFAGAADEELASGFQNIVSEQFPNGQIQLAASKGYPGIGRTLEGTPNFSGTPYLYSTGPGQLNVATIRLTGSYAADEAAANAAAGLKETPAGYVWHHLDYDPVTGKGTLQLAGQDAHLATIPHSGGVSQYEHSTGQEYK
jgi:RHS repeat-associated protein